MKKRTRKKIWFLLDIFFLGLPILMLGLYIIILLFGNTSLGTSLSPDGVHLDNFWNTIIVSNDSWDANAIDWWNVSCQFWSGFNYFSGLVGFEDYSFFFTPIARIFDFFGISAIITDDDVYGSIFYFIENYLCWILSYEFIKLFINLILWIPRWLNDKFSSLGGGVDD